MDAIMDLPYGTRDEQNVRLSKYEEAAKKIKADLNTPMYLGRPSKVNYDHKTDRYTVTFHPGSENTATLKATNPVVEIVTSNMNEPGAWYGHMEDGVLVDINLFQA